MRWLMAMLLVLGIGILGAYVALKSYPYRLYAGWISGKSHDQYFSLPHYRPLLLTPVPLGVIAPYKEDYVQLWKEFPIGNSLIPLPTRHPLFQSVPIIEVGKGRDSSATDIGIILLAPTGREISRIYTLPTSFYQDHSQGQKLFKLPYVRNRILKKDLDTLWKDIFSYQIEMKSKPIEEMIYDLYILHLRSKILPHQAIRYGLIKNGQQAVIELVSKDKDYIIELVLTQNNGTIYSYALVTEKLNEESMKLRSKFLESISFSPVDEAMGNLLYTEFKQLNFARQVDQEGMLHLFSAWTQNAQNLELLKEMIFFLERGPRNERQLKALYEFAFKKYGKTFTTRKGKNGWEDPNLTLQRNIELEERERRRDSQKSKGVLPDPPELTPDEKINQYLKKAKEAPRPSTDDMTVH